MCGSRIPHPLAWSPERRGYDIGKRLGFLCKRRNFYQPITLNRGVTLFLNIFYMGANGLMRSGTFNCGLWPRFAIQSDSAPDLSLVLLLLVQVHAWQGASVMPRNDYR